MILYPKTPKYSLTHLVFWSNLRSKGLYIGHSYVIRPVYESIFCVPNKNTPILKECATKTLCKIVSKLQYRKGCLNQQIKADLFYIHTKGMET